MPTRTHGLPHASHATFWRMPLRTAPDHALVNQIDRRAGPRRRSPFIAELARRLGSDCRRPDIDATLSALPKTSHEWDGPPVWMRRQRSADRRRTGRAT